MKKTLLPLFVLLLVSFGNSELLVEELFDYTTGNLAGKNGGRGWDSAWYVDNTGSSEQARVVAGNLTYSGISNGNPSNAGKMLCNQEGDGTDDHDWHRLMAGLDNDGRTYWMGFTIASNVSKGNSILYLKKLTTNVAGTTNAILMQWDGGLDDSAVVTCGSDTLYEGDVAYTPHDIMFKIETSGDSATPVILTAYCDVNANTDPAGWSPICIDSTLYIPASILGLYWSAETAASSSGADSLYLDNLRVGTSSYEAGGTSPYKEWVATDSAINKNFDNANNWMPTGIPAFTDSVRLGQYTLANPTGVASVNFGRMILVNNFALSYGGQISVGGHASNQPFVWNAGTSVTMTGTLKWTTQSQNYSSSFTVPNLYNNQNWAVERNGATGKHNITYQRMNLAGSFVEFSYWANDTTTFTDSVNCTTFNIGSYNGSPNTFNVFFGDEIFNISSSWFDGTTNYNDDGCRLNLQTSDVTIGGSFIPPSNQTIVPGTSMIRFTGTTVANMIDGGRQLYDMRVNKTTSAGTWAWHDTTDTTICNDFNSIDGQIKIWKNLRCRDFLNSNQDSVWLKGNRYIARDLTFATGNKIKATYGKWVMAGGTLTLAAQTIDSVRIDGNTTINGGGVIKALSFGVQGKKLTLESGKKVTLQEVSDNDFNGGVGALDSIVSSTPGTACTLHVPNSAWMKNVYWKDVKVTGDTIHCPRDSGCLSGGGNF